MFRFAHKTVTGLIMVLVMANYAAAQDWRQSKRPHLLPASKPVLMSIKPINNNHLQAISYHAQARLALKSGAAEKALKAAKRAIELEPDDHHSWELMGEIYHAMGAQAKAMRAYNKAHALDPDLATTCEYG